MAGKGTGIAVAGLAVLVGGALIFTSKKAKADTTTSPPSRPSPPASPPGPPQDVPGDPELFDDDSNVADLEAIQHFINGGLTDLGYHHIRVDGILGPETCGAHEFLAANHPAFPPLLDCSGYDKTSPVPYAGGGDANFPGDVSEDEAYEAFLLYNEALNSGNPDFMMETERKLRAAGFIDYANTLLVRATELYAGG